MAAMLRARLTPSAPGMRTSSITTSNVSRLKALSACAVDAASATTKAAGLTQSANSVFDLLREVSTGGTTFLIVTHDPRLAARCDRLIEMVDGRIQSDKATVATKPSDDGVQGASP